jgi:hypothetical protein
METAVAVPTIEAAGAETLPPAQNAVRVPALSLRLVRQVLLPIALTAGVVEVVLMA